MTELDPSGQNAPWTVASIVAIGTALPLILYELLFGQVATVTPQQARQWLREPGEPAVLVDVRRPAAFSAGHIDGAVNWPLDDLLATRRPEEAPREFRHKQLLLVCEVGLASCRAAWGLRAAGVEPAVNVRGGIQEWIHSARGPTGDVYDRWRIGSGQVVEFPFRESPLFEQILAVVAFFLIKPIYTLLSLAVAVVLWRSPAPDLTALRWAMISFFLGENACAANYLLFKETSLFLEYLHSCGMLLCFGFTAYAVLEGVDRRILKLSDPRQRCASLNLCAACIKYTDAPCGLKRTFYLIIPVFLVLSFALLSADWQDNAYNTFVFGEFYNYGHLRIYQLFENWYCGASATVLFAVSLLILACGGDRAVAPAKIAFAAGLGPFGFGLLRMILGSAYDQNRVWYLVWEETTEFLFILGICFVLWTFRHGLLPGDRGRRGRLVPLAICDEESAPFY